MKSVVNYSMADSHIVRDLFFLYISVHELF